MYENYVQQHDLQVGRGTDRTIIYCQDQDKCAQLSLQVKMILGQECFGAPDLLEFRLFDYFTSATHESVKKGVLKVSLHCLCVL